MLASVTHADQAYGRFDQLTENDDSVTRYLRADVRHKYVRAVIITGGTTVTSFTPTIDIVEPHYQQVNSTRTA